jgi:hypothetical protein
MGNCSELGNSRGGGGRGILTLNNQHGHTQPLKSIEKVRSPARVVAVNTNSKPFRFDLFK